MPQIINVSNRLPVTIGKKIKKSSGGLVSAMDALKGKFDLKWIGWPGAAIKNPKRAREIEKELREVHGCIPVQLKRQEISDYYHGFSNSSLWPLLHYMSTYVRHNRKWWEEYRNVNKRFAAYAIEEAEKDDMVWIHDYHLMLMPQMVREKRKDIKIGFFLHTPFPSYEVFRCHPHRYELLEGLLGADLIGFHTFGYMRHFNSSVMRLLGVEAGMDIITYKNRHCHLGVFPIGINSGAFIKELASKKFRKKKEELAEIHKNKRIVLSVERLDYTKGVERRLLAIDKFLDNWVEKDNIVFIFISVPSRGEVPEYQELRDRIELLVGRINGKHSTVRNTPIHFIHKSVDFSELCALYSLADVAMVTPLIDGMNLVAKEYVACKKNAKGVLMLSEFAGAAEELFKAISVNPYDTDQVSDRLKQALTVPDEEKLDRMKGIYERVMDYDAEFWAKSFLRSLEKTKGEHVEVMDSTDIVPELIDKVKKRKKIACFLDYDGTLVEFKDDPKAVGPTKNHHAIYKKLNKHKKIDTYIISGRNMDILKKWFEGYDFTLIAEHGYRFKLPGSDEIYMLSETADLSWKPKVREILEHFAGSTPGSFVEEKISSLVWHYRRSDPEFGHFKAQQMMSNLYEILSNLPVEVHHGKKIIEVSSMQVNKGAAIETFTREKDYDLIICAGDDQTDESMFAIEKDELLSIKIGDGDTKADYRVKNPHQFRRFLKETIEVL